MGTSIAPALPIYVARKTTVREVSLVNVSADPSCAIRSISNLEASMPDAITPEIPEASETQAATWSVAEALELNRSAASLRVPSTIVDDAFARGLSVDQTRRALISAAAERDERVETRPHRIEGGVSYDDPASIRSRMAEAILHRANPGAFPLSDRAREFRGLSLADMKGRLLEARGVRTRGLTSDEILTRADVGGLHTTSDFPLLLADALHKELDRQIVAAQTPLKALSRERTASDFRTLYVNRIGNASGLEKVNEAGEFKRGTWGEEREDFALATYGRIWGITRQVLVNDDLSFFTDIAEEAALAVAELEASRFVALLVGAGGLGAIVSDGKTAFHADHKNIGTASAPDVASLSQARQLLRAQKGVGRLLFNDNQLVRDRQPPCPVGSAGGRA
jgi:hypothetical protein